MAMAASIQSTSTGDGSALQLYLCTSTSPPADDHDRSALRSAMRCRFYARVQMHAGQAADPDRAQVPRFPNSVRARVDWDQELAAR